jgi:hypothetical protein
VIVAIQKGGFGKFSSSWRIREKKETLEKTLGKMLNIRYNTLPLRGWKNL